MRNFALIDYLQDSGHSFQESGKNISRNWIGMNCPFCDDSSNHLGINLDSKIFSCFRCGEKGGIPKLIMSLENKSYQQIVPILKEYGRNELIQKDKVSNPANADKVREIITKETDPLYDHHKDYLRSRGFDPDQLERDYDLRSGKPVSIYKHRILIPYKRVRRTVTFTTRDVSGKATLKYIHCPSHNSVLAPKEILYNVDNCKDSCLVVEGCFDVFRIGSGSVSLSGIQYTTSQLLVLSKFKQVFLLFDPEEKAQEMALQLGHDLSFCSGSVDIIQIKIDCDPGDMKDEDIKYLKKYLLGR